MPTYNIERWDAIILKDATLPLPMIYIKADEEFLKYAEDNNYYVVVTVEGTGMYDGKVTGVLKSSGYFPDYRPNFYNDTKYYVMPLLTGWKGYPTSNGTALLQGIEGPDALVKPPEMPYQAPLPIEWYESPTGLRPKQIWAICFVIAMIFIILLGFAEKRR
jgi:hypothetical protein